ncbi:MAG: hypothetical protein PHH54_00790 [Candidatus Nanoarchaeia archaeon]|nr:hypothetical protein [Candidatus Nanoarchaeia archaeon]MDD5740499.1 hypothetical protein [Candidatus Nanoarchaeia archaeon]
MRGQYCLSENPNCAFYLKHKEDNSKIWVNGGEIYCCNKQCVSFDSKGTPIQFDEFDNSLCGCVEGAVIGNGIPVDVLGRKIDLEKVVGLK